MQNDVQKGEFKVFDASGYKVAIVAGQFNRDICDALTESAVAKLTEYGINDAPIFKVPGSIEIPVILKKLAEDAKYDALIAIGCIIRGDTPHFDYVAKFATEGILRVSLDHTVPIGFGILTTENPKQALARTDAGAGAVTAALESAQINRENL